MGALSGDADISPVVTYFSASYAKQKLAVSTVSPVGYRHDPFPPSFSYLECGCEAIDGAAVLWLWDKRHEWKSHMLRMMEQENRKRRKYWHLVAMAPALNSPPWTYYYFRKIIPHCSCHCRWVFVQRVHLPSLQKQPRNSATQNETAILMDCFLRPNCSCKSMKSIMLSSDGGLAYLSSSTQADSVFF